MDPRPVARPGVDRLSDAVARLRRQRDRRALPVRRSGDASRAGSASASSSSASGWSRELTPHGASAPAISSSPARCSTRRRSPASPRCCARARSRAAPGCSSSRRALSAFCGGRPVRVLTSATAAIEVALQLCGIGAGDEVITSAQSFFTVLNMIVKVGATPVFVDCDLVTRNIDLAQVEAAHHAAHEGDHADALRRARWSTWTRSTRSRERRRLRVIEDAALVHGLALEGPQRRRVRRSRHLQLPSQQEHHVDRRRRAGRQRRRRSEARRGAALPRHHAICPTARATSRFPAASSTCPTSMRASACAQLAAPAGVPRQAPRARRALLRALRAPTPRACCRRARLPATTASQLEHVLRAAAARRADDHAQGSSATRSRRAASAPACRTRRCTCARSAGASAVARGSFRTPSASRARPSRCRCTRA